MEAVCSLLQKLDFAMERFYSVFKFGELSANFFIDGLFEGLQAFSILLFDLDQTHFLMGLFLYHPIFSL